MEEKIRIIDEIVKKHPSIGVEKGWSHYTGGMKDSGDWYFRKMLAVDLDELKSFLKEIIEKENRPPRVYTEQEKIDMKIIHRYPEGYFQSEYHRKELEKFRHELACGLLGIKPY